jgi:hypothetical protein
MSIIEKVTCFPNEGVPQVIDGEPSSGDLVRIKTDSGAVIYERYTPPDNAIYAPSQTEGRNLKWGEFLEIGARVSMVKFNAVLAAFPIAVELGRRYVDFPGLEFEDASKPGTLLGDLIGGAVQAGIIDPQDVSATIQKWVETFPKMTAQ